MKNYKRLDYKVMEQLTADYQNGNQDAAIQLVDAFRGYMMKFQQIVCGGPINLKDPSIRMFLGLFLPRGTTIAVQHNYIANSSRDFHNTASLIREIFSPYDQEEIEQELVCTLLYMAKRHQFNLEFPKFHMYVKKAYHFYFFRQLKALAPSIAVAMEFDHADNTVSIDMDEIDRPCVQTVFNPEIDDDMDENWIAGITCSAAFLELTPFERRIIKMHYYDKMTDAKIADRLGRTRGTITKIRNNAKGKIISNASSLCEL